ncbi:defense 3 [Brachionus plicatilis]|uniref:Defense 3 n=1 Tax=Brachionus plicatilis TaxID=10195 RepID=A0A3M7R5E3_BRAPC|nr:defense 3 [Brachionus plicatilis]
MKILILFFALNLCNYVYLYPNGAPLQQCDKMMPGHGATPLDDQPPYQIIYLPNNSSGGFDVSIISPDMTRFKGFLIQARGRWDGKAIGKWQTRVPNSKAIDCFGFSDSAVTHNWHDDDLTKHYFQGVTFTWVPPYSRKLNRVKFVATIVQSFKKIYYNVSSQMMLKSFKLTQLN